MNELIFINATAMVGLLLMVVYALAVIDKKLDRLIDVVERGLARLS